MTEPARGSGGAWSDRYLSIRNRWLASPKFQRWAAAFPLTRPTARRRARALFDVCAGFVYSQILYACVQLDLFNALAEGPQSAARIAERLNLPLDAAERLCDAAASLELLEHRSHGRFGLGTLGAALIGNPGISSMIEHHRLLYSDLRDPIGLLRGNKDTELGRYWAYARADLPASLGAAQTAEYTALMARSQALIAGQILDAYPLDTRACLLDVGGGDGSFLVAAALRYPKLRLMLFDLPPVAARAQKHLAQALESSANVSCVGGDFFAQALPRGADVISMVRVLHDHDDERAAQLLAAAFSALEEQGVLLLAEPMALTAGAEAVGDAYFGFYLLAMGQGRPRSAERIMALMREAGFADTRVIETPQPLQAGLVVGRKPSVKLA